MQTFGSVASVVAAIRDDGAAEAERIEQQTSSKSQRLREECAAATVTIADRAEQLAAARQAVASEFASIEWEGRRAVIEQREAWLKDVQTQAIQRWRTDQAALTALALEALDNLPPLPCEITVSTNDRAVADAAWCAELAHLSGKPAGKVASSDAVTAGCIATCGDVTFDNSLAARSHRLESRWRNALSKLYAVKT